MQMNILNILNILIDRQSVQLRSHLRSGWRALVFVTILGSPWLLSQLLAPANRSPSPAAPLTSPAFDVGLVMILSYLPPLAWVLFVSWGCLKRMEGEPLGSLGLGLFVGWKREITRGLVTGTTMTVIVVLLQLIGRGSQLGLNPYWFKAAVDPEALRHSVTETLLTVALFTVAALFEELLYRGYAFQTLLRGVHPVVPIIILSTLFGLGHWGNPNRTLFSTVNTVLAGVWLSVAYLRSRNLWYPTALHLSWNVTLGPLFGLPVSGRLLPAHPLLLTSSGSPVWLTGGSYGSEGGAAATVVLLGAIVVTSLMKGRSSKST